MVLGNSSGAQRGLRCWRSSRCNSWFSKPSLLDWKVRFCKPDNRPCSVVCYRHCGTRVSNSTIGVRRSLGVGAPDPDRFPIANRLLESDCSMLSWQYSLSQLRQLCGHSFPSPLRSDHDYSNASYSSNRMHYEFHSSGTLFTKENCKHL